MKDKEYSEFGKGLVYNLVLFTNHFKDERAIAIIERHHGYVGEASIWYKTIEEQVWFWVNAASDHLYELCTETGNKKLDKKLLELRTLGLNMGHVYDKKHLCTYENFVKLRDLTIECAMLVDKMLGVEVIEGEYE